MDDKWPPQYTLGRASAFLQSELPSILSRLQWLEAEVSRLEQDKQARKGRKPAGADALAEDD